MSFTFSVIKKNQILTWCLIIILGVAGYMNYKSNPANLYAKEVTNIMDENLGDAIFVDSTNLIADLKDKNYRYTSDEYFIKMRLDRNTEYENQIITYEKIILSADSGAEQKEIANNELKRISNEKNALLVAENLIKLNGFGEGVILLNNGNANVVVLDNELDSSKVVKIQNIIQNELGISVEKVHITSFMGNN